MRRITLTQDLVIDMGFSVSLKFNEKDFDGYLNRRLKDKVALAVRQGLNRAVSGARTEASDQIRDVFNPKAVNKSKIFEDVTIASKAQGIDLDSMHAKLSAQSHKGVSLIRFADNKRLQRQKGIAVKKRSAAMSLTLKKSKRTTIQGAFIQKGSGGQKQVFRAKDGVNRKGRLLKQTYKSISAMLQDHDVWPNFERETMARVEREVAQAVGNGLDRLK